MASFPLSRRGATGEGRGEGGSTLARSACVALLAASLLACTPNPAAGPPPLASPAAFAEANGASAGWPDAAWWQGFRAPELDRLVAESLASNIDLAAAAARLRQADERVRIAGSALLPSLDASAGGQRSRTSTELGGGFGRVSNLSDSFDAGLTAAWQVDLWGGNRAALRAARASGAATAFERDALALETASAVAETYFRVLSLRDRLRIARANLANARRVLGLVEVRAANGAASALDLARQRTQVANQEAGLPSLEQQERQTVNALALLLGRPLDGFGVEADSLRDLTPVQVVAGVPGDLLRRRPDLAAAEARLAAADADVAAARAALYPSLDLTARAGLESDALRSLLSQGNVVAVALSIAAPIFDAGLRRGQVRLSEAQRVELLEDYRGTALEAFADVEDALVAVRRTREREAALGRAADEARRAFALAEAQYRAGAIDLFELLDTQRALFSAEDAVAGSRLDRLSGLVALYRALGGGWGGDARPAPATA